MQTRSSQASAQTLGQDNLILETPPLESQSASGPRASPPGPVLEDDIRQLQARLLQAQIAEVEARTAAIVATIAAPLVSINLGKNGLPIVRNAISFYPGIDSSLI
jgi:hypothetical protein